MSAAGPVANARPPMSQGGPPAGLPGPPAAAPPRSQPPAAAPAASSSSSMANIAGFRVNLMNQFALIRLFYFSFVLHSAPDQEKAQLIMQVLQLSDAQIALLPPEQRQSILILKEQISRSKN